MDYSDWLKYRSRLAKRDVSKDAQDYDLESYYKSLKYNPKDGSADMHLPDTYKLPNHPTFSNESMYHIPGIQEGGEWVKPEQEGEKWRFKPSDVNLRNMSGEHLQDYFKQADPDAQLDLSNRFNTLIKKLR